MRTPLLLLGLLSTLFAGCASSSSTGSTMSRIDANRAQFDSWPYPVQDAILSERVINGMNADMVRMALGEPTEISTRQTPRGEEEVWMYRSGGGGVGNVLGRTNVSIGGGLGGVNVSGNPMRTSGGGSQVELTTVVFRDGQVISETPTRASR